jgi:EpsI family protein
VGIATIVVLAVAAVWPAYAAWLYREPGTSVDVMTLTPPVPAAGWNVDPVQLTDWRPHYQGARASLFQTYRKGDRTVALYLGYYEHQQRGAELVTSTNVMIVQKHPVWSNIGVRFRDESLGHGPVTVRETRLSSASQRLLIWDWDRVAGRDLTNPYVAKLVLAGDRLLGRGDDAAAVILATPYDEQTEASAATLREFARDMLPSIDTALAKAGRDSVASAR